ncbi:hypothetical protein RF11_01481 [Thelohanellus kitauei]|uniref:Uncharacterized protein n=1 Tax=Thelohanellus kitauei TaxID=669202 RepID=A0A0C2IA47_THEKT|nr:hypothetical protein RF11_01481 [Thelohanellus kitauei]
MKSYTKYCEEQLHQILSTKSYPHTFEEMRSLNIGGCYHFGGMCKNLIIPPSLIHNKLIQNVGVALLEMIILLTILPSSKFLLGYFFVVLFGHLGRTTLFYLGLNCT